MLDTGEAYNATAKRGWINQTTTTPLSIVGNARDRNVVADQRLDSFIHMQYTGATGGVAQPARWEAAVQNGIYDVTVAVGDVGTVTGSTHRLTVESTNLVNNFTPGSANKIATVTGRIQVTDGKVTLDAAGGTNTKLDYVDIIPVTNVLGAGATLARINFGPTGAPAPHRYTNDTGAAYTRHPRLRLDQPDRRNAAEHHRQRPGPQPGARPAPRHVHAHAVHRDLRRRRPAGPLAVRAPDGHLRRHRLGR